MPRYSRRKTSLRAIRHRVELAIMLESSSSDDDDGALDFELSGFDYFDKNHFSVDSSDGSLPLDNSSNLEDSINKYSDSDDRPKDLLELYFVLYNTRYFVPRRISNKSTEFRQQFFHELTDGLFRQVTRMKKSSFFHLLQKVETCPIFMNNAPIVQAPVEYQLAVCLDRLGHDGNGACLNHIIPTWGVSVGSLVNFSKRCFHALELVLKDSIAWPLREERVANSEAFAAKGFPGCIGLIDGTLMSLSQRPHRSGEVYWTRKSRYSFNVQVVCDHSKKIMHMFAGMPGSCSDMTCTRKSLVWTYLTDVRSSILFEQEQYILGDFGYQCMPHLACSFKRSELYSDKEAFNTCVAKCRVTNEHCIGVLKSRWHSLKEIRVQLKQQKDSLWMVRWVVLCGSLHNYVMSQNDDWTPQDIEADLLTQAAPEPDVEPAPATGIESGRVCQQRLVAAGNRLLARVMERALEHHRQPRGIFWTGSE